jgi:hypothetical protein
MFNAAIGILREARPRKPPTAPTPLYDEKVLPDMIDSPW